MRARFVPIAILVLATACNSVPWRNAPDADEVNLAFTLENNLIILQSGTLNGKQGRFFFGAGTPRTVIDPRTARSIGTGRVIFGMGERESVDISPVTLDLGAAGDALIGADVIGRQAVTIDYRAGLVTLHRNGLQDVEGMQFFSFATEPKILITANGRSIPAIVDTSLPDTLVLPAAGSGRGPVRVSIAGVDFGEVDVRFAQIPTARVGNRVLSKFLIGIDYGRRVVGLWRDPRIR